MSRQIEIGAVRRRGEVTETVIHDVTRIGNPVGARVFEIGRDFIVIPEDKAFPVVERGNFHSAVNYFEQIVSAEDKGDFHF